MSERGGPLTHYWFNEVVVRAAKAAGIQSEKMVLKDSTGKPRHFQEVHAHILRLFWKHQMRTGGVTDPDLLNFMLGHTPRRSEEHTSELQSRLHLVCRLLLEKKKNKMYPATLRPKIHTTS